MNSGGGQPINCLFQAADLDCLLLAAGIWILAYYQKGMVDTIINIIIWPDKPEIFLFFILHETTEPKFLADRCNHHSSRA